MPSFLSPLTPIAAPPVGGGPTAPGSPASHGALRGFAVESQSQSEWCWAAVSRSIAVFFGTLTWTQCQIASAELSLPCCTSPSSSTTCNVPWYMDAALSRVGHFDRWTGTPEPLATIQSEIAGDRPLGARVAWAGGGAHFIAIGGWLMDIAGQAFLDIHDPFYGESQVSLQAFNHSYRSPGDTWTHSYFVLSKPLAAGGGMAQAKAPLSA